MAVRGCARPPPWISFPVYLRASACRVRAGLGPLRVSKLTPTYSLGLVTREGDLGFGGSGGTLMPACTCTLLAGLWTRM